VRAGVGVTKLPAANLLTASDVYAVLVAATGCSNLWSVSRLTLRRYAGLASPAYRAELQEVHPRDLAVARWYVWLYLAGTLPDRSESATSRGNG
jgi:hypothetical protein